MTDRILILAAFDCDLIVIISSWRLIGGTIGDLAMGESGLRLFRG